MKGSGFTPRCRVPGRSRVALAPDPHEDAALGPGTLPEEPPRPRSWGEGARTRVCPLLLTPQRPLNRASPPRPRSPCHPASWPGKRAPRSRCCQKSPRRAPAGRRGHPCKVGTARAGYCVQQGTGSCRAHVLLVCSRPAARIPWRSRGNPRCLGKAPGAWSPGWLCAGGRETGRWALGVGQSRALTVMVDLPAYFPYLRNSGLVTRF